MRDVEPRPRVRSLALRLTLAFACVGLLGALLVAFFVGQRTQVAFDQFVTDREQASLVAQLAEYYQQRGSWAGVAQVIRAQGAAAQGRERGARMTLVGSNGQVIVGNGRFRSQGAIPRGELNRATPVVVDGTTVGWLLDDQGNKPTARGTPEDDFLERLTQALVYGATGATMVALLLGMLLARTLTRPLRELTAATESLAQGSLGQQVVVRSRDELGTLAVSFNRMSADLARARVLRRQMTADIAHDLRTPLSVILGYTEALREGKLLPDQDMFDTMHTEAQHLQHLIDDLRVLSLADAGELPLTRQHIAPHTLLDRAAATYAAQASAQGIALDVQALSTLPLVWADAERMAQVFGNLLANALRYTPACGSIALAAAVQGRAVEFQVRDTGSGIDTAALPHIFERFYRADAARQHPGSSGLGLAIVKSIVEAHGGSIHAESAPGQGTLIRLSLPVSPHGE
ncbi:MAG: HAMP domain-containing protein [Roseiflexaceae bacterium]|nr:HAMP domain-containing protein [Roseiflexaceae bacterium]